MVAPRRQPRRSEAAVALGGSKLGRSLPRVVASGRGELARRIIERAQECGLAVEQNADLAQVLVQLDLGDSVPEEVFMAVAEVLYYVFELNASLKEKRTPAFKAD